MKYKDIDPILNAWAKRHGLYMHTEYKDDEVRDTDIIDDAGNPYGLYVSEPDGNGDMQVSYAGNGHEAITIDATLDNLDTILEKAYSDILRWITDSGNTRTPV